MRLILKLKKDMRILSIPKPVIQKITTTKKSALLPVSVEIPDPIQGILGSENSSKQNDFNLLCIFLLYSEPGSVAPAIKDDLQCCFFDNRKLKWEKTLRKSPLSTWIQLATLGKKPETNSDF